MAGKEKLVPFGPIRYMEASYRMPETRPTIEGAINVDEDPHYKKYTEEGYEIADVIRTAPSGSQDKWTDYRDGILGHLATQYGEDNVVSFSPPTPIVDIYGCPYEAGSVLIMVRVPETPVASAQSSVSAA
jgi:hypothetical protein